MLTFLRKIRKSLIEKGNPTKYILYAVGEIGLVVIGILIALQINNWNEHRKLESRSLEYLQRLKVDLDNVSRDVNGSMMDTERKFHQASVAFEALETMELKPNKREDFENHLKEYYQFSITIQNTPAYHEMLSSGDLGLLKNEWLRTAFADLSEARDFLMEVNQSNHNAYKNNKELIEKHVRYHIRNFDTDSTKFDVTYDFDAMTNDDLFINQISNDVYIWYDIFRMYKRYERRVQRVQDSIQVELKKYDSLFFDK